VDIPLRRIATEDGQMDTDREKGQRITGLRDCARSGELAFAGISIPDILKGWRSSSPALADGIGLRWVNVGQDDQL